MDSINFYSTSDDYGEFSNFAKYPISIDGKIWPTTEHYFQAQKFKDPQYKEKIRKVKSASLAARLGRDRKKKLRRDWESVKVSVMERALYAKFSQHELLRELLLSTGEALIVEHTSNDSYWGDGGDGSGKNMLGTLLVRLRSLIRET